ncbi:transcriptional regulator domain-containing protein [Hoeflea sp.]|uniref:transcriptional regulator domain-containing protein n=1 Tax=Hoeflea sp. TaxID=1940281 RepID=UPI003B02D23C
MPRDETATGAVVCADWRDGESYASLHGMDRTGWAWQWLRRNPDFAATSGRMPPGPRQSGKTAAERQTEAGQLRIIRIEDPGFVEDRGVFFHRRYFVPVDAGVLAPRGQSVRARH